MIGIALLILLAKAISNSELVSSDSFRILLGLNILFIFSLIILIAVQIFRLLHNIKKEITGSRLTLRLVLSFALMGIIPVLIVYLVSVNFLTKSIESWFDVKVESALEGGLTLGQKTIDILMKEKKFGRMLHVSSIGVKYGGGENTFNYSLSKHLLEFSPSFIKKLTRYNLLSNVLRVGFVKTKIHKKIKNKNLNKRINLIPIKRAAKVNEITDMIFFLASEKNSYISNETITIAGGE